MKNNLFTVILCIFSIYELWGQFKYDNTSYRTVYLEDLCRELHQSPRSLLLDVRSEGEYQDTSTYSSLNIGRLKNSLHIDVRELGKRIHELDEYKNLPVYIYCSHSQRSRRASKMLSDSGFTVVMNINGGMTELNVRKARNKCLEDLYQTGNSFKLVSPSEVGQWLKTADKPLIIDIRSDSVFSGLTKDARLKAFGRIKGAIHIPANQLNSPAYRVPQDKSVLLVDNYGDESAKAAKLLIEMEYSRVFVLFNGMDEWSDAASSPDFNSYKIWIHPKNYELISSEQFGKLMENSQTGLVLDVRTADEFNNRDKIMTYHNTGHIQGALNIPVKELEDHLNKIRTYKNKTVMVYAFSNSPEAFEAAQLLSSNGFKKVKVLSGGVWGLRWKAANIKGQNHLMKYVVDVPEENL